MVSNKLEKIKELKLKVYSQSTETIQIVKEK
jgi:hypothetical protein